MDTYWESGPRASTEFAYRGIEAAVIENGQLRITVLTGKGGDVVEFRDKTSDVDVLWHADHNWRPLGGEPTDWLDHYPGGWQDNLPLAGWGGEVSGTAYGAHGETALLPWEATVIEDDGTRVTLRLETDLVRYPFTVERDLTLEADDPTLHVDERVTNTGEEAVEYIWQQHVALGPPLLGPEARLRIPTETGYVDPYRDAETFRNGRLDPDSTFEWPHAPLAEGGTVDVGDIPPREAQIHDQVYANGLTEGWYALDNEALGLGFGLSFPTDPFESVWVWQALGGFQESPFFGRNYTLGVEPTTAYPAGSIPDAQRENGTMKTVQPGESVEAEFAATVYRDLDASPPEPLAGELD